MSCNCNAIAKISVARSDGLVLFYLGSTPGAYSHGLGS